jgi:nitroreductase
MDTTADTLVEAATLAGHAPSIHNSQPWRWVVRRDALDLYREHNWRLRVTDPDGRLSTLSCGAALHHAVTALAAQGFETQVARLPDPADPSHLARIAVTDRIPVAADAVRAVQTLQIRHTDRRPVTGAPIDDDQLRSVTAVVEREGAWLHVLPRDGVIELGAATSYAQKTEAAEPAWQAELAYWTGGTRPTGSGIPDTAIPERPTETTVASRDFGHAGTLPISAEHDQGATFVILYGQDDDAKDWLRAGEALSAAWLTAIELGVSVLPLSATVEVAATRVVLRRLLSGLGEPYLVLRLGRADPDHAGPPHPPRLPTAQNIEQE